MNPAELKRLGRLRNGHLDRAERADERLLEAVLAARADGMGVQEIARHAGLDRQTVYNWIARVKR